jgi:hypothetical protein
MKRFALTLQMNKVGTFDVPFLSIIEADNLVELFGKLPLEIIKLQNELEEKKRAHEIDDDIPF